MCVAHLRFLLRLREAIPLRAARRHARLLRRGLALLLLRRQRGRAAGIESARDGGVAASFADRVAARLLGGRARCVGVAGVGWLAGRLVGASRAVLRARSVAAASEGVVVLVVVVRGDSARRALRLVDGGAAGLAEVERVRLLGGAGCCPGVVLLRRQRAADWRFGLDATVLGTPCGLRRYRLCCLGRSLVGRWPGRLRRVVLVLRVLRLLVLRLLVLWLLVLELMLMVMRRLLLLRPRLAPRRRGLPPARHGWMRGVLWRGRSNVWLTDLIGRVLLLPLVAHLGLLWRMLVDVLAVLRVMCLLRLRGVRCAHCVLGRIRMPRIVVALCLRAWIHARGHPRARHPHVRRLWGLGMIGLERRDRRRWRLSRVASIRISGVDVPARERCYRWRGWWRLPNHLGLRRQGSLHRRNLGDPLGRRIIVEQRHDVDFALWGARRSRSGLLLGQRERRNDGRRGGGNGHRAVLLLHRHRCVSWHAWHGPLVRRGCLGRLWRRLTKQRTHWLRVDRRRIRLQNWRRRTWRFRLSRERRHLGPSSHDPLGR